MSDLFAQLRGLQTRQTSLHSQLFHSLAALHPVSSSPMIPVSLDQYEELACMSLLLIETDSQYEDLVLQSHAQITRQTQALRQLHSLKSECAALHSMLTESSTAFYSTVTQITGSLQGYKSRCRDAFLQHLRNLDLDLRKILKPLVPSTVLKENIQYPPINENPSLQSSSAHSRQGSTGPPPEITESTAVEKLSNHVNMVVASLESVAKDLMGILGDANREYYELLNEKSSAPGTPLGAPLPEYFEYRKGEKQILVTADELDKGKIRKKLKRLRDLGRITRAQYMLLLQAIETHPGQTCTLNALLAKIPSSESEEIAFALLNTGFISKQDVTYTDLFEDFKKPERPKEFRTFHRKYAYMDKLLEKKLDSTLDQRLDLNQGEHRQTPIDELMRKSPAPRIGNPRGSGSRRKAINEPTRILDRRTVKMRSVTPVGASFTARRKTAAFRKPYAKLLN